MAHEKKWTQERKMKNKQEKKKTESSSRLQMSRGGIKREDIRKKAKLYLLFFHPRGNPAKKTGDDHFLGICCVCQHKSGHS